MSDPRNPVTASPAWWIVCRRETRDLWIGGKALYLILIYCFLLGGYAYLMASNADVALLPVREMIQEMVRHSIAIAVFICLIVAADSPSELTRLRERAVAGLGLMVTPLDPGQ